MLTPPVPADVFAANQADRLLNLFAGPAIDYVRVVRFRVTPVRHAILASAPPRTSPCA